MIMDLMNAKTQNHVVMVFGCPFRTDILYPAYFETLNKDVENFHFIKAISREEPRADGTKRYVQSALVDEADVLIPILKQDNTLIYICGLKGMETGILTTLLKHGLTDYVMETEKGLKHTDRMFVEVY
jgi:ferredoxin--NADP+ reductase